MSKFGLKFFSSLAGCLLLITAAEAGNVNIPGFGGLYNVPSKSNKERRWDNVLRQKYDMSCGSAAIATLLTHHYGMDVTEDYVFLTMFEHGDQEKIRREGFSLLDMKRFLDSRGLRSDGFRVSLDQVQRIGVPVITLINTNGFNHFVVIKGIQDDRVAVADPALGTRIIPRQIFEGLWNGTVLAARENEGLAKTHFNQADDWAVLPRSPVGEGRDQAGLGTFLMLIPASGQYGFK